MRMRLNRLPELAWASACHGAGGTVVTVPPFLPRPQGAPGPRFPLRAASPGASPTATRPGNGDQGPQGQLGPTAAKKPSRWAGNASAPRTRGRKNRPTSGCSGRALLPSGRLGLPLPPDLSSPQPLAPSPSHLGLPPPAPRRRPAAQPGHSRDSKSSRGMLARSPVPGLSHHGTGKSEDRGSP